MNPRKHWKLFNKRWGKQCKHKRETTEEYLKRDGIITIEPAWIVKPLGNPVYPMGSTYGPFFWEQAEA